MAAWDGLRLNARRPTKRASKLPTLLAFDAALLEQPHAMGLQYLLGVDEVGRGSLVGPVVAAAAIIPTPLNETSQEALYDLDDSKAAHWTHDKRVTVMTWLQAHACWGLGEASVAEIERLNIAQASLLASHRAVMDLASRFPHCALQQCLLVLDGRMTLPSYPYPNQAVVKADGKSAAVAAASVIAKAYRDAMMRDFALTYPQYGWEQNAGYPTPAHQAALLAHGVTPLHRKTYQAVARQLQLMPT